MKKSVLATLAVVFPLLMCVASPVQAESAGPFLIKVVMVDEWGNAQLRISDMDGTYGTFFNNESYLYIRKENPGAERLLNMANAALLSQTPVHINRDEGGVNPFKPYLGDYVQNLSLVK